MPELNSNAPENQHCNLLKTVYIYSVYILLELMLYNTKYIRIFVHMVQTYTLIQWYSQIRHH